MSTGGSRRVTLRFRVLLFAFVLPLVVAVGVLWLGQGGARATQLLVHQPLTLHGGPGAAFSVLATLASGTKVEVLWCNAEASWCLVENGEVEGWAPRAELITRDASSTRSGNNASPTGATASNSLATAAGGPAASIVGPPMAANSGAGNAPDPQLSLPAAAVSAAISPAGVSASLSIKQSR
jgi:uncharacterized protein YraI